MSQHTTNWGIVGTGWVARNFAEGLQAAPGAKLVAVASRTQEKAESFARAFGATRGYGSNEALAADAAVDAIYIATPNQRHLPESQLFINAGKAVLCEKPLALNADEAREIAALARSKKVFAMEAMWMRYIPAIQRAKQLIDGGAIGRPLLFDAAFGYPIPRDSSNRFLNPQLGGGTLLDRGIYPLSLAYFLFGDPAQIDGQANVGPTGVDEQSSIALPYDSGLLATMVSTFNTYASNRATIVGTRGQIEICAPFFKAEKLIVSSFPDTFASSEEAANSNPAAPSLIRKVLSGLKRRLSGGPSGGWPSETIELPLAGNGYNYEAVEVGRCLAEGLVESPSMTLDESIKIAEAMDRLILRWNPTSR